MSTRHPYDPPGHRVTSRRTGRPRPADAAVLALSGLLALASAPAAAVLPVGAPAPAIRTQAALAGEVRDFVLADALAKGPVVLYFYPAAFTQGCTIEAHQFAEATEDFAALGARVVGVSTDDIDTLKRFSLSACQSRFAVAADPDRTIIDAYDARLASRPTIANRVSYVITPDRRILFEYTSMKPEQHVERTLQALREWAARSDGASSAK
ncbi:MAG: peroxiredoxin [Burkholderiaceae bacterium]